jgi:hypothetical protein
LCELAATNDSDLLAQVVVASLGVQPRARRSLAESVCDYLSGKQALIVLDNCEHLLDAAAEMAEAMLRAAPAVRGRGREGDLGRRWVSHCIATGWVGGCASAGGCGSFLFVLGSQPDGTEPR